MDQLLIQVIVPIYNVKDYIKPCLDSILRQTYSNLEIILVNDGSTDEVEQILDEYASKDSRIKVINQENLGLQAARNKGLDNCTGEYISFIDSDDAISDDFYTVMHRMINQTNSDISMCGFKFLYTNENDPDDISSLGDAEQLKFKDRIVDNGDEYLESAVYNNFGYVMVMPKLYKRDVWKDLRFPLGKYHEDEWVIAEVLHNHRIVEISDKLYYYRQRKGQITGNGLTVKKLDSAEAMLQRVDSYKQWGLSDKAILNIYFGQLHIFRGYFPLKDPKIKKAYKEILKTYRQNVFKYQSDQLKTSLKRLAIWISPQIYWRII